jgi:hypothetical protein
MGDGLGSDGGDVKGWEGMWGSDRWRRVEVVVGSRGGVCEQCIWSIIYACR